MSPLTKVFVVLLVLASLLQTAGTIVFINKIQPLQTQLSAAKAQVVTANAAAAAANQEAAKAQAAIATAVAQAEANLKATQAVIQQLQNQLGSATVQIAQLNNDKASRDQQIATLTQSLNMAQATNSTIAGQVTTLRATNDKLVKQQEDDSRKIAELTSLSETLKSQFDNATEQLAASKARVTFLEKWIVDKTGQPAPSENVAVTGAGAQAINGLLKEKKLINGSTYVTISVGAADGVAKGMRFNVIDNNSGDFLGFVTVETVDNNDSIGRVEGDAGNINRMAPGNEVKTQLRGS